MSSLLQSRTGFDVVDELVWRLPGKDRVGWVAQKDIGGGSTDPRGGPQKHAGIGPSTAGCFAAQRFASFLLTSTCAAAQYALHGGTTSTTFVARPRAAPSTRRSRTSGRSRQTDQTAASLATSSRSTPHPYSLPGS
jgi:hypothetical protein